MEAIKKLESKIEEWLKPVPHLPTDWQKWIANNIWWMTLIAAVLMAVGVFGVLSVMLAASPIAAVAGLFYPYTWWWYIMMSISVIFMIIMVGIIAKAVRPLRTGKKVGWDLLFLATVISIVISLVNLLSDFEFGNFLSTLIAAFISFYLLFEIRGYFIKAKS